MASTPYLYVNSPFASDANLDRITPSDFVSNPNLVETERHLGKLLLYVDMRAVS